MYAQIGVVRNPSDLEFREIRIFGDTFFLGIYVQEEILNISHSLTALIDCWNQEIVLEHLDLDN